MIKLAEGLYHEALDANAYFNIIKQYGTLEKQYKNEMRVSPAFYQIAYDALIEACFMKVAKLFEKSSEKRGIGLLLEECYNNKGMFHEYEAAITTENGEERLLPYKHLVDSNENRFLEKLGKEKGSKLYYSDEGLSVEESNEIEFTFSELITLYRLVFCSFSKKRDNVYEQRNELYAHISTKSMYDSEELIKKNPVLFRDIADLIEFALKCTRLVICNLTGVCKPEQYKNIGDLENTLILVGRGLTYQDISLEHL